MKKNLAQKIFGTRVFEQGTNSTKAAQDIAKLIVKSIEGVLPNPPFDAADRQKVLKDFLDQNKAQLRKDILGIVSSIEQQEVTDAEILAAVKKLGDERLKEYLIQALQVVVDETSTDWKELLKDAPKK